MSASLNIQLESDGLLPAQFQASCKAPKSGYSAASCRSRRLSIYQIRRPHFDKPSLAQTKGAAYDISRWHQPASRSKPRWHIEIGDPQKAVTSPKPIGGIIGGIIRLVIQNNSIILVYYNLKVLPSCSATSLNSRRCATPSSGSFPKPDARARQRRGRAPPYRELALAPPV